MTNSFRTYDFAQKATQTPQSRPIPGRETEMVKNAAGGYVFQTTDWDQLNRFLVLGTTGGSYYIGEKDLTQQNCEVLDRCIAEDAKRVVDVILDISLNDRALKQD